MRNTSAIYATAAILAMCFTGMASAAAYPDRPLRMIVPFAPGGASDFVGRILEPPLSAALGQNVVVDNRAGASGYIGVETAAQASPDGYTLLLGNVGTMAINASVFPRFAVKPLNAFTAVTQVVDVPGCLIVHPSLPVASVKDLIAYAKSRPGKLNYSAAGAGSNSRLAFEYFMRQVGIDIVMVAYKGGAGGAALGVAQGEVQLTMLTSSSVLPYVRSGRAKLIAVIAPHRLDAAPDTMTMVEAGFPELKNGSWQGMFVPKGTSTHVVLRLFQGLTHAMQEPEVARQLGTASAVVVLSASPQDFRKFWATEDARWAKVVREVGVQAQ